MVPFPMVPTNSAAERRLYEGFLRQLDDEYVVYHSVDWVLAGRDGPIQGEADFVIGHPRNGLLIVEAKGGSISFDPHTKRWTQSGRSGRHLLDEDPFHQAADEMHSLVQILSAQPGWERWKPSYGYGVALPDDVYDVPAHPSAPPETAIDRDDLQRLAERVPEVMRFWLRAGRRFGTEGMDALATALGFRVEVPSPLATGFGEGDRKIVELTNDQAWTLSFVAHRKRAAVTGPAGGGKTLLAIQLSKRLAAGGLRTLLTCFSRRLGQYLRASTEGVEGLDVGGFHDVCIRMVKEAGFALPGGPGKPGSDLFERELPESLERAAHILGPRYDAMVVDEAHDFREWWWPALLALHRDREEGMLYLFADDNQKLYGDALPVGPELRVAPLPTNVRNTKAIHEFVSVFYEGEGERTAKGPAGRPPQILEYRDDDDLAHLLGLVLGDLVRQERVSLGDIVVLTPGSKEKSRLRSRGIVDGFRLSDEPEPRSVLATSVDGFRGLERPVVILAELDDRRPDNLARYVYVGGSRARNHLVILAAEPVARELRRMAGVTGS